MPVFLLEIVNHMTVTGSADSHVTFTGDGHMITNRLASSWLVTRTGSADSHVVVVM